MKKLLTTFSFSLVSLFVLSQADTIYHKYDFVISEIVNFRYEENDSTIVNDFCNSSHNQTIYVASFTKLSVNDIKLYLINYCYDVEYDNMYCEKLTQVISHDFSIDVQHWDYHYYLNPNAVEISKMEFENSSPYEAVKIMIHK